MIAKILGSSASFNGVSYNTNKIDNLKGELMLVKNFGPLEGIKNLRPEDYKNYLQMVSSKSRTKEPQFHVAISCLEKECTKVELSDFAVKWMKEMGYEKQPYLVVFHSDTNNNHVHVVSTRIDQQSGLKINDSFEKKRACEAVNKILNLDTVANVDIEKAEGFNFRTVAQFNLLLEQKEYVISNKGEELSIIKFGKEQAVICENKIKQLAEENKIDVKRANQLKAIFNKYKDLYNSNIKPLREPLPGGGNGKIIGYKSQLSDHLKTKFGLDIIFHFKNDKTPYGYTIIDNANKNVFKGGEILNIKEFVSSSLKLDKNWFSNILNEFKKNQSTILELDKILNENHLNRQGENVFDINKHLVYTFEQNDLKQLVNNQKTDSNYLVFSSQDKSSLTDLLDIPSEQIVIDYKEDQKNMYADLLNAAVFNFSSLEEGLIKMNLSVVGNPSSLFLLDSESNTFIKIDNLVNDETKYIVYQEILGKANSNNIDLVVNTEKENILELLNNDIEMQGEKLENPTSGFQFFIAGDIDDEAINGRNRKRKKHARGNSR
jgi:hypothetical protein